MEGGKLAKSSSILRSVSFKETDAPSKNASDLINFGILRYHGRFSVFSNSNSNCNNGADQKPLSCISGPCVTHGGLKENRLLAKQQKRLLLLRHSAKCKDSNCRIKAKCTIGKNILKHLSTCTNHEKSCKSANCYSSSVLLRHFIQCTDEECELCLPLRVTSRNLPELKRRRTTVDAQAMPAASSKEGKGVKRAKLVSFASSDQLEQLR